jgi:hypothetical protein
MSKSRVGRLPSDKADFFGLEVGKFCERNPSVVSARLQLSVCRPERCLRSRPSRCLILPATETGQLTTNRTANGLQPTRTDDRRICTKIFPSGLRHGPKWLCFCPIESRPDSFFNVGWGLRGFFLTVIFGLCPYANSEYQHGFVDVNINHLDWTRGTEEKSHKRDFNYLELEGGGNFNWGELYGFFDLENFDKSGSDMRTAAKGAINAYLFNTALSVYAQVYNFTMVGFSEQNRVVGLSYSLSGTSWWFKPWIGFHDVIETFYSGRNGYMGGWTVGYMFKILGQNFMLSDWHEWEFDRNARYAARNGASSGINGAASVWWNETHGIALGFQWRYAQNKLGTPGTIGAVISTLRYTF